MKTAFAPYGFHMPFRFFLKPSPIVLAATPHPPYTLPIPALHTPLRRGWWEGVQRVPGGWGVGDKATPYEWSGNIEGLLFIKAVTSTAIIGQSNYSEFQIEFPRIIRIPPN
jgi:hypothetical protein